MSVILVVERDARRIERISEALRRDSLSVESVASRAEALSSAEQRTPALLVTSSTVPEASALLADFSRDGGGPGAIVTVPDTGDSEVSAADLQADAILAEPFSDDELRELVQLHLTEAPDRQPAAAQSSKNSEQLTSEDIFGDMLAEVEAEAQDPKPRARKPSLPMKDIERRLEETLSGVISTGKGKRHRIARAPKVPRRRAELPADSEIDDLLDQTLSSLDIPTRSKKKPATTEAAPSAPKTRPSSTARPSRGPSTPAAASKSADPAPPPSSTAEQRTEAPFVQTPPDAAPNEPSLVPSVRPSASSLGAEMPDAQIPASVLADLESPADQFRTQALPTLGLSREAAEGETFGDYTLLDRIAIGGMAEVWRARRRGVEGFQKTVAIKKILSHLTGSQDFVTMFIDEAKLAAQLSHNNITQIYDLGKVGNDFFIAMEHVDGKDLRSILTAAQRSGQPIPIGLGLSIVSAVARALDYAHRKRDFDNRAMGLVHRDVSPQNVMISYEGAIKLCDFGIAKAVAKASTTQMGALKGKLQYMSPEQAWGKSVDARSDIFSLGSVLFEVLTGSQLFSGESEIGVLDAVRECRIQSPRKIVPEISEEVSRIALKALAKTPDERYQTAGEMEHEIRAVLDSLRPAPSQTDLSDYLQSLFKSPERAAAAVVSPEVPVTESPATHDQLSAEPTAEPATDGPPAGQPEPTQPAGGRWKWLAAAVVAAAVIGGGFFVWPSLTKKGAPEPAGQATPPPPAAQATPPPEEPAPSEAPVVEVTTPGTVEETVPPDAQEASADGGDAVETTGEELAEEAGEDLSESGSPITAAGIDIEQMVNEELSSRAEQLRRDFEAEKKRIEEELAKTQAENQASPQDDEGGDGEDPSGGG